MNQPLRHVALVVTMLFLLLFGSTTAIQVVQQSRLDNDSRNARAIYDDFGRPRGSLVVDGTPIASSSPTDDIYGQQRSYDPGMMYAPVTGHQSVVYGSTGLERSLDAELSGDSDSLFLTRLTDVVSGRTSQGATVDLTLDPRAQEAAWEALKGRRGAVVALDPRTGAVLAMVSAPSYDPNRMASHSGREVREAWSELNEDRGRPLSNRAIAGDLYPPGSTFKLLVAASALETGRYTKDSMLPGPGTYRLPQSRSVMNNHASGGQEPCGPNDSSTLQSALEQSCNTTFAMLAGELGEDQLASTVQEFGFGERLRIPLSVTPSRIGSDLDGAQLASTAIGQYEDRVTPLQMAMVAGAVANDGVLVQPQLVQRVRAADLTTVSELTPQEIGRPLTAANARQMREMMTGVVTDGTGNGAAIDGVEVGGKTGTAEWAEGRAPHSWFVGYARTDERSVAVAVVVEEGGYGSQVAAPIAQDVMEAVVGR
ncbi:penicillin-binding protein 2 [Brachybacterium sp. EF45031]|uniref:peptidoglycan D,D-transpeptidase FtsI family protein n=1 Tax=Brachybacterium sillae TaxID=2810536 RepID=UPI00217EBF5C|nr:penicillin-binding protein 2 [Brachybacterium sillae]MCS6712073.1 penicillin-binding protein 2 [Brachybacterium sillae]